MDWTLELSAATFDGRHWTERFRAVRGTTTWLCEPLAVEDYQLQSMPDCSPPKWHLAHTTWFLETFLLTPFLPDYRPFHPRFGFLFNSYYEAVGARWPRPARGLLSRPTVAEVQAYRHFVDDGVVTLLGQADGPTLDEVLPLLELGVQHEQQHQELLLMDVKHAFGLNPLAPAYADTTPPTSSAAAVRPLAWRPFPAGVRTLGHAGDGFAFDNESPRHRVFLESFAVADRLVTAGEYLAFIEAGGYERPEFWLSDGWAERTRHQWVAPLYWHAPLSGSGQRELFTLHGSRPLDLAEPVCHVSFYEADAYARWAGARLPTEAEWETAAPAGGVGHEIRGNFLEAGRLHPRGGQDYFGDLWQWTASPYTPYPGYRAAPGAVGEYNGKFMCNQMVLRGGSCVTPAAHVRGTYRNFFPPDARWPFTGFRLARDNPS